MNENNFIFETAFERLETILRDLNENKVPLEDSLKLFEEANGLISNCEKYLIKAELKIETLIKNKNNELELDDNNQPRTKSFSPTNDDLIIRN